MFRYVLPLTALLVTVAVQADQCQGDDDTPTPTPSPIPNAEFSRFCRGEPWDAALEPVVEGPLSGTLAGSYNTLKSGDMEVMKYVPEHPFHVKTLRIQTKGGAGEMKLRLMKDYGRSQPDVVSGKGDLTAPISLTVAETDAGAWIEVDVSQKGIFLLPTQHYFLVYEHLTNTPYLAVETLPAGETSRALLFTQDTWYSIGSNNYRMELAGDYFCKWAPEEHWFQEATGQPFASVGSQRATLADVDGDRDDDLITNDGKPKLFLNNGGTFAAATADPWPDAWYMSMMAFGDMDNDGDVDAVGLAYVSSDSDGDGYYVGPNGLDCNDTDATVYPGAPEVAGNGRDDNCDNEVDGGTDLTDDDGDGDAGINGDCDDTRKDVYPGALELLDKRDNDCDNRVDEDNVHRVFLNDGKGHFTAIRSPELEVTEPAAAAALGDGNGDGLLDLYIGNWLIHYPDVPSVPDRYLVGAGGGVLLDKTSSVGMTLDAQQGGLPCYGVVWGDYNNDGLQDIYVGNYGYGHNFLWENHGGTFLEVGDAHNVAYSPTPETPLYATQGGNTFGVDFADFDNDGDLDLFAANIAHPRYQPWSDISQFYENQGAPDFQFVDIREEAGVHFDEGDVNASFMDFDNDGDQDLLVTSLYTGHYATLYRNDGARTFTDVTYEAGIRVHDSVSNVYTDVDHDGDLDLFLADRQGPTYVHLFRNQLVTTQPQVALYLEGRASNRSAIGARVYVRADGVVHMRDVKGGGGHSGNQSSMTVYVGLGDASSIEEVRVRWPGKGVETFTGVELGGRYQLVEGTAAAVKLP